MQARRRTVRIKGGHMFSSHRLDCLALFRRKSFLLFALFLFLFLVAAAEKRESAGGSVSTEIQNANIASQLRGQYMELLIEKGICDDRGDEIDGRIGGLIEDALKRGRISEAEVINDILDSLNYSPTNLGRFPECAFDRPIGHKLARFGRTISPGNIEAQAEGSACPVGGIGAGAFERTISGNFRYWFLKSGWMVDDTVWADQFHVFTKKGTTTIARTLSTDAPASPEILSSWKWRYPEGKGSYYALFPKSGFSYEKNEEFPVKIAVTQYSPILPHNYRETSYPVAVYKWIAENPGKERVDVSVMLTWQNIVGWETESRDMRLSPSDFRWDRKSGGNFNQVVEQGRKRGILFKKKDMNIKTGNAMTGTMCIAAEAVPGKRDVFFHADFDPKGSGADIWQPFANDGSLSDSRNSRTAGKEEELAGALAVKFTLQPGERVEFPIVIAWDFPFYEFEKGVKYRKKYTEFFGSDGENAFTIAAEALDKWSEWERAIDKWQGEIIENPRLPGWLKQALFNELYVLAETSLWDASTDLHTYLESVDYLMYGTFDVDAYSSWHLLKLWPELELNNMRFFARTVELEDPAYKIYQYPLVFRGEVPEDKMHYYWDINKVSGMVPHDIGSPRRLPWVVLNAFDWQNGNVWKDLNPKFPLRAYRDFLYTGAKDYVFLKEMFKASVIALDTLEKQFGHPESHIPLNEGIPDQTYDTWKMKGESAYVSVLWLAALKATSRMGEILICQGIPVAASIPVEETITKYKLWFDLGRNALQKLWNEESGYFHIDASTDDIMTDQLFGVWYAKLLELEGKEEERIIRRDQAERALRTIYQRNVLGFGEGLMGAVNGRTASGRQLFSQQGDEVWTGTTYAYASNCILHGLAGEGLHAAYGVYYIVYGPYGHGYFFKTPEAYCDPEEFQWNNSKEKYGDKVFRAMKYMRPGAVWAVYEALTQMTGEK